MVLYRHQHNNSTKLNNTLNRERKESLMRANMPLKYKFRYEQILQYVFLAGEIPVDLYKYINITNNNYKKVLFKLRQKGYIKTIINDKLTGYVLTTTGKKLAAENIEYYKYAPYIEQREVRVEMRRRQHNFAYLYTMFDRLNIAYEPYKKVELSRDIVEYAGNNVVFYTAQEFRATQGEQAITIRGSRFYGILVGKGEVIPIYKTRYELIEFRSTEISLINLLSKYFRKTINKAIFMCDNDYAIQSIMKQFIFEQQEIRGKDITEYGYYKNVYMLSAEKHLNLKLWTLYHEETMKKAVSSQFKVEEKDSYLINDGFINDMPLLFCLNYNIARLRSFLLYAKQHKKECYIATYDFMLHNVKILANGINNIRYIEVKSEPIERKVQNGINGFV